MAVFDGFAARRCEHHVVGTASHPPTFDTSQNGGHAEFCMAPVLALRAAYLIAAVMFPLLTGTPCAVCRPDHATLTAPPCASAPSGKFRVTRFVPLKITPSTSTA